jgi:uncharacterized protein involved in outer membrane biogenesis
VKKALKWTGIGIGTVVVLLLAGLALFSGALVKWAVNAYGPGLMGVPVTLEAASCRLFAGKIKLTNLHVGNPEGFKTPSLFDLGEVDIDLDMASLFSETIVIRRIAASAPHITYEKSLLTSNFSELMKQWGGDEPATPDLDAADAAAAKAQEGGRRIVIDRLVITDPALNVSIRAAGGHYVPVKLGRVEMQDIGKDSGGMRMADVMAFIFSVITSNIENALLGAGDLIGSGAKAVGHGAGVAGGAVVDGASSVIKGVGQRLGGDKKPAEKKP